MKKKFVILNFLFGFVVLTSILLQSVHSFEHISSLLSEKKCNHKHIGSNSELTHQHHGYDHCFACEFTFSNSITPENFTLKIPFSITEIPYFFSLNKFQTSFSGSLYSLRGPPNYIV